MAVIFGNDTSLRGGNSLSVFNASNTKIFEQLISSNNGVVFEGERPGFIAGVASDPGWVTGGSNSAWNKISRYNNTVVNKGGHYSTTNTRFTAPFAGPYFFMHSVYFYVNDYIHPVFAVNGGVSTRRYSTPHKIRQHGMVGDYQHDMQIEEVIQLEQGDFVEVYVYISGRLDIYPEHGIFAGVFVG